MLTVEERTDYIEMHLFEATKAHNTIVDIQDEQVNAIRTLHLKAADLEDRSQWNKIKIRGVPESLATPEIVTYLHQFFLQTCYVVTGSERHH